MEYLGNINHCSHQYHTTQAEEADAFGPDHEYQYQGDSGGMATAVNGKLGVEYPQDGYTVQIPKNATQARALLQNMKVWHVWYSC